LIIHATKIENPLKLNSENSKNIRLFLNKYFNINIFPSEIYFLNELPSHINYESVLIISIFSILITFVASLLPALSASKLDPIKNLKNE